MKDSIQDRINFFAANPLICLGFGPLTGYRRVLIIGNALGLTRGGPPPVWGGAGGSNYVFIPAASPQSLEIVSASASDAAAGTGTRSVTCNLLDANFTEVTQTVTLNGTTPVAIPGGPYLRCNGIVGATAGSNGFNVGQITLRSVGGAYTLAIMQVGDGVSKDGIYTVPAGKTFSVFTQVVGASLGTTNAQIVTCAPTLRNPFTGAARTGQELTGSSQTSLIVTGIPGSIAPEKTDIELRVISCSANSMVIDYSLLGVLMDNAYA